jgi:hypothetical protein
MVNMLGHGGGFIDGFRAPIWSRHPVTEDRLPGHRVWDHHIHTSWGALPGCEILILVMLRVTLLAQGKRAFGADLERGKGARTSP